MDPDFDTALPLGGSWSPKCYHRGMAGRPADWARWLLILGVVIGGLRLLFGAVIPILPNAFAWGAP